jgi:hypothetical protein
VAEALINISLYRVRVVEKIRTALAVISLRETAEAVAKNPTSGRDTQLKQGVNETHNWLDWCPLKKFVECASGR